MTRLPIVSIVDLRPADDSSNWIKIMLKNLRHRFINRLWETYYQTTPQMQSIADKLAKKGTHKFYLDHFAVIDLPGVYTGISQLQPIYTALGFTARGAGYLAQKQNDFSWLCEKDCTALPAAESLPQVVVADFRMDELPLEIKKIIEKYSSKAAPSPLPAVEKLSRELNSTNTQSLLALLTSYFIGRDWPLPTTHEYHTVQEFNELLAWVLVFGRRPNHFTLSIHLMDKFKDLNAFSQFVREEVQLAINQDGGEIKGGAEVGIAQGSTTGQSERMQLADGTIQIPTGFVEYVWRYPRTGLSTPPKLWNDYFTDFIPQHANHVIESLYS